jgi:acetylglutamate kinase
LRDINDEDSLISSITFGEYIDLKSQGVIAGGMIPKIDNSFKAIQNGVSEVVILHAKNLLTGKGTKLIL